MFQLRRAMIKSLARSGEILGLCTNLKIPSRTNRLITHIDVFPDRLEEGDYDNSYFLFPYAYVKTSDTLTKLLLTWEARQ